MKATNVKRTLTYMPEILLVLSSVAYFAAELIALSKPSYTAIACALIVVTLVVWKNKYFAIILSMILGLVSIYMLLAVLSEYNEFPSGDPKGWQMLLTGTLLFTTLLGLAILLPKKYISK